MLIYRGGPVGLDEPVPSIRLKALRRGLQDYVYFWLLDKAGQGNAARRIVASVVHAEPFGQTSIGNVEIWKNDPEIWLGARVEAGERLSKGIEGI